jgi:hypothetical protein
MTVGGGCFPARRRTWSKICGRSAIFGVGYVNFGFDGHPAEGDDRTNLQRFRDDVLARV